MYLYSDHIFKLFSILSYMIQLLQAKPPLGLFRLVFLPNHGLYLKPSLKVANFLRPIPLQSLNLLHMLAMMHLGAWLRIVQYFSLLLFPRSLPWVFNTFSHIKEVEKSLRMFPQFRNVASLTLYSQETSWLYNINDELIGLYICFTLFILVSEQITNKAASCWEQVIK